MSFAQKGRESLKLVVEKAFRSQNFRLENSDREKRTTFSDAPLLLEIFWDLKSLFPTGFSGFKLVPVVFQSFFYEVEKLVPKLSFKEIVDCACAFGL